MITFLVMFALTVFFFLLLRGIEVRGGFEGVFWELFLFSLVVVLGTATVVLGTLVYVG